MTCSRKTSSQGQGHSPSWTRRPSQVPSNLSDSVILSCDPQSPGDARDLECPLLHRHPRLPRQTPLVRADAQTPFGESCWPEARAGPSQRGGDVPQHNPEGRARGARGSRLSLTVTLRPRRHQHLPAQQRHPRGLGKQGGESPSEAGTGLLKPRPSLVLSSAVLQLETGEEEERSLKGGSVEG